MEGGVACIFKKKKRGKKEKSEEKTEVVAGEDGGNGGATGHRLRLKKDAILPVRGAKNTRVRKN